MSRSDAVDIQRGYYARTADQYDEMHLDERDEHSMALNLLLATFDFYGIRSVLDIGCGTGRALRRIKAARPDIRVLGIEPVKELREVGHAHGLTTQELVEGDATRLAYADGSFDIVTEFGVLHHLPKPAQAVSEMLRVARKGIFISDCNNFGQGSGVSRAVKQFANAAGLWGLVNFIKTRGKGYSISEGDGLYYSYSVFNDYERIRSACERVHLLNTLDGGVNPYRTASQVALLGIKPGVIDG